MQRRTLLRTGLATTVAIGIAGAGAALWRPGWTQGRLTADGRAVLHAVARAVLDGSLPPDPESRERSLSAHLGRVEAAVQAFPPVLQAEVAQLLAVLSTAPGRFALTGLSSDWPDAPVVWVQAALESMRQSRLEVRQQAYHALRDLTNAAFYADPQTWELLGYPGPVPV